jgi:CubicO group peptidase (beta-lactamase class C family)
MMPVIALLIAMSLTANAAATAPVNPGAIDELFHEFNQPNTPGASVLVMQDGKVLFHKGYGFADLEKHIPCTPDTDFRLASVSKQFTAMAVLLLLEQHKLKLDETLLDFFPEFPAYGRQITVRQLLTHCSGLLDYEDLIPEGTQIPVLDRDVLRLLMRQDKTSFPPGTKYHYSNSAYSLLALIVEVRSGNTFAHFLKQNIFAPLHMDSTLAYEQGSSVIPHRAYGYTREGEGWKRTDQSLSSSVLGDGGIYSCVPDLARWNEALFANKLIPAKLQAEAFTPHILTDKPGVSYGYGWYITEYRGLKEIYHSGESRGFTTRNCRFPEKRFCVIILTNRNDAPVKDLPNRLVDLFLFPSQ